MIVDANQLNAARLNADLCIIGAGAAGITLAREFEGTGARVLLLESGGDAPEPQTQSLYDGENIGNPYFDLSACRVRQFGGTTGHWGGACWPLEPIDFEQRDWVPHSGWPITRADLDPYYVKAQEICGAGPFDYDVAQWADEQRPVVGFVDDAIDSKIYQNSSPPRHFGKAYRKQIESSENVTAILHANVTGLRVARGTDKVRAVDVATLSGTRFAVAADWFVLATGGIENARLLLVSDDVHGHGLGNGTDLVGRFFMEHTFTSTSVMLLASDIPMGFYTRHRQRGTDIRGGFGLSEATLREERILNVWCGLGLQGAPPPPPGSAVGAAARRAVQLGLPQMGAFIGAVDRHSHAVSGQYHSISITCHAEQAPNAASRVTLAEDRDTLGMRRVKLAWRLSELDFRSVRRSQEILGRALGGSGLGRLKVRLGGEPLEWTEPQRVSGPTAPFGSYHHMGTTRMHPSPGRGVVDQHCRVHEIANLYVAGSSVFPTCGYVNPTLTIVALTCRLADHLRRRIAV